MDANLDLAGKYGVPLKKGVPALAVLSEHGALLYSQKNGEFEAMRQHGVLGADRVPCAMAARAPRLLGGRGQLLADYAICAAAAIRPCPNGDSE